MITFLLCFLNDYIVYWLYLLFQHTLNNNTLPSVWKEANVIPIYKEKW